MTDLMPSPSAAPLLDDRIRGVPPGTSALRASDVVARRWRPFDGSMALPVLTLDEAAFLHNRDLMMSGSPTQRLRIFAPSPGPTRR
jgi:hypothetical protein